MSGKTAKRIRKSAKTISSMRNLDAKQERKLYRKIKKDYSKNWSQKQKTEFNKKVDEV